MTNTVINPTNDLLEYCRKYKIRLTPQRMEIYDAIVRIKGHPNAEEIFTAIRKKLPHTSLDTVYKNLGFFEKIGILSRVKGLSQQSNRFEINHKPHHHFCCEKCQKLYDLTWEEFDALKAPALSEIGEITHSTVTLYGVCKQCFIRRRK